MWSFRARTVIQLCKLDHPESDDVWNNSRGRISFAGPGHYFGLHFWRHRQQPINDIVGQKSSLSTRSLLIFCFPSFNINAFFLEFPYLNYLVFIESIAFCAYLAVITMFYWPSSNNEASLIRELLSCSLLNGMRVMANRWWGGRAGVVIVMLNYGRLFRDSDGKESGQVTVLLAKWQRVKLEFLVQIHMFTWNPTLAKYKKMKGD